MERTKIKIIGRRILKSRFHYLLLLLIILIPLISSIYPGGCGNLTFEGDILFFEVTSNTPIMNFFSWNKSENQINYCFAPDTPAGEYSFRWSNEARVIEKEIGVGGTKTIIQEKEIPKFIDKFIPSDPTEIIKEVPSEPKFIDKVPLWMWITLFLSVLVSGIFVYLYIVERGSYEYGNEYGNESKYEEI